MALEDETTNVIIFSQRREVTKYQYFVVTVLKVDFSGYQKIFHFDFPCICTQISELFYSLHQKKNTTSCLKSVCLWIVGVFFSISCLLLEVELVSCPANSGQYFRGEIISGEAQFWGEKGRESGQFSPD